MRKMKVYRNAAIALLMTVMFTACMNDPDPVFDIMGDVFVTKKIINDEIKYAPNYFVYSNIGMNSAKVTLPNGGGTVDLEGTTGGLTYKKEAVDSDYSLEMPDEGNYLFEAVSTKDETLQVGDELQLYDLEIPVVDSIEFLNTSTMQVSWNSVSGADGYFLKIVDANGDDVFLSLSLDANAHDYTILEGSEASGNWKQSIAIGQTYTLQINAFSYDADAYQSNSVYNIQEVAIGQTAFTWE